MFWLILLCIVLLAVPIGVIILFVWYSNLKHRLNAVEAEIQVLMRERLHRARDTKPAENQARNTLAEAKAARTETAQPEPPQEGTKTPESQVAAPPSSPATTLKKPEEDKKTPPPVSPKPEAQPKPEPLTARVAASDTVVRTPPASPKPYEPGWVDKLIPWLQDNWFYVVSAISLGLAGIFLVQYGIENGLLPPAVRVAFSMLFGTALIGGGEFVRRRWGDDENSTTAFLPSTFSAAGVVVLYASILAARGLYGLIGPETAFAGLVLVAAIAMVMGGFYGPFLAAAGLSGASVAPFLVGGNAESGYIFYFYYGILGVTGLAIDAMRRWGWVSFLGLGLSYAFGAIVFGQDAEYEGFAFLMMWLALMALAVPRLEVFPSHPGAMVSDYLLKASGKTAHPTLPVWIAAIAVSASTFFLFSTSLTNDMATSLAPILLAVLTLALTIWARNAPALTDLALIPGGAFLLQIAYQKIGAPDQSTQNVLIFLDLSILITLAAFWRSLWDAHRHAWALAAVLFAPVTVLLLDLMIKPAETLGTTTWAAIIMAMAALMVFFAERYARRDQPDKRRAAWATLSALSLIALALFTTLSGEALTVALTALIAVAAWLDRRFNLFEMGWFILAGTATLGWRLMIAPGLKNYISNVPLGDVILAFGAVLIGLGAALWLLSPRKRTETNAILESGLWAYGGVFASILVWRWVEGMAGPQDQIVHWSAALLGLNWAVLGLAQIYRLPHSTGLRMLRLTLALGYTSLAALTFVCSVSVLNPFLNSIGASTSVLYGTMPLDTLFVAYGIPGLVLIAAARWLRLTPPSEAPILGNSRLYGWSGGIMLALYILLETRRFWHRDFVSAELGYMTNELYAYTVILAAAMVIFSYLDRRFRLSEMPPLVLAGAAIFGWRLILVPGLAHYTNAAGLGEILFAFGTAFAGIGGAWLLASEQENPKHRTLLETILWGYGGILVGLLAWRFSNWIVPSEDISYFSAAILSMSLAAWCLPQLLRLKTRAKEHNYRILPIAFFGGLSTLLLLASLTILNPAFGPGGELRGIPFFDTLLIAYAFPALIAAFGAYRLTHLPWAPWRHGLTIFAGLSLTHWVFLEIRHFWQGDVSLTPGFSQPEVYTYTVALLIIGGGLLYQSIARQSQVLRRVAMGVIALTVAKVFFIDAGGLTGLLRVFSFLALGLVLAGLAWLNRWAALQAPEEVAK